MALAARQPAAPRSELVRLVAELAEGAPAASPAGSLAERLADWLGWTDAITLAATLADDAAPTPAPALPGVAAASAERLRRARASLVRQAREADALALTPAVEPADLRRHLQARQRSMDTEVAALRSQARAALAAQSPRLHRLARLDAALEAALVGRERVSLALLPSLLERRYTRERASPAAAADAGWCQRVAADVQAALRAELELRLQPVDGLIDALRP